MILPSHTSLRESRRLGRVALTALVIGFGVAAVSALPLADVAFAEKGGNGGGNGGGGGHGGGNGGGHGGGNGGGQGHGGGNGGGNGNGHGNAGDNAKAGKSDDSSVDDDSTASSDDATTDDGSMQASKLGKLNGFFHASPNGLANASPNSAIGRISQTFRDALSDFAEANQDETDTDTETDAEATPPTGPSVEDLGAILAGATNKPVTATQVQAIIDRLAEQNPDDDALNDLADNPDDETAQDIADAANAVKSGEPVDESDDGTDTSTDTDTSAGDGTDATGETPVTAATN